MSQNNQPDISLQYRSSISKFATGIAVVSNTLSTGEIRGMTINSLTSISLAPPTLMISLRDGVMLEEIQRTGKFGISILAKNQKELSNNYSRKEKDSKYEKEFITRFDLPTLDNCLSWFECETVKTVQYHDHTLIFGEVIHCGSCDETPPLLFFSSNYHADPQPLN